jgi:hypothetical protein
VRIAASAGELRWADRLVPSWRVSTIPGLGAMTIPAPEPDPRARGRAGDCAAEPDAVAGGGERSAPGRGELRLLAAPERDADGRCVIPEAEAAVSPEGLDISSGTRARRLRLARPVQLELVSGRQGPGPEVVWASLPERSREAVLMLLGRLIDAGAVEEREIEQRGER